MTKSDAERRSGLIDAITRGIEFPLPPLGDIIMRMISIAIYKAYTNILANNGGSLLGFKEVEITTLLEIELNNLISKDPNLKKTLIGVKRGAETINYNSEKLEKRPDLTFIIDQSTRRNFPLTAECKIVDKKHRVSNYCNKGVSRFVEGDYAWGTQEAAMIAYVRDDISIHSHLLPYLQKTDSLISESPKIIKNTNAELAVTNHDRLFMYQFQNIPPGPIQIWHLWLK